MPVEDVDVLAETLLRARPVVLRGYGKGWKARSWGLEEVSAGSPDAHVELQVSRVGSTQFHGFGGTLQREPLQRLPAAAAEALEEKRSLYLVQCPLWARGCDTESECPARHLLKDLNLGPFAGALGARGADVALSRRLDSVNLWMSLGETHSNLHYDSKHGLLVVIRGRKLVELFPPAAAKSIGAYPVHDPLRSHHSRAPHCCLAARFERSPCEVHGATESLRARGLQADLREGDALLIPEGWWHHVKTLGREGEAQPMALAVNIWWRGYPREPKAARPYVLRRLLGEMLARRTASHFNIRQKPRKPRKTREVSRRGTTCLKSRPRSSPNREAASKVSILEELSTAARSEPPHREWLAALRRFGSVLPHCLAAAAASPEEQEQDRVSHPKRPACREVTIQGLGFRVWGLGFRV